MLVVFVETAVALNFKNNETGIQSKCETVSLTTRGLITRMEVIIPWNLSSVREITSTVVPFAKDTREGCLQSFPLSCDWQHSAVV